MEQYIKDRLANARNIIERNNSIVGNYIYELEYDEYRMDQLWTIYGHYRTVERILNTILRDK